MEAGRTPGHARAVRAAVRRSAADVVENSANAPLVVAGFARRLEGHAGPGAPLPLSDVDVLEAARPLTDLAGARALRP